MTTEEFKAKYPFTANMKKEDIRGLIMFVMTSSMLEISIDIKENDESTLAMFLENSKSAVRE